MIWIESGNILLASLKKFHAMRRSHHRSAPLLFKKKNIHHTHTHLRSLTLTPSHSFTQIHFLFSHKMSCLHCFKTSIAQHTAFQVFVLAFLLPYQAVFRFSHRADGGIATIETFSCDFSRKLSGIIHLISIVSVSLIHLFIIYMAF